MSHDPRVATYEALKCRLVSSARLAALKSVCAAVCAFAVLLSLALLGKGWRQLRDSETTTQRSFFSTRRALRSVATAAGALALFHALVWLPFWLSTRLERECSRGGGGRAKPVELRIDHLWNCRAGL